MNSTTLKYEETAVPVVSAGPQIGGDPLKVPTIDAGTNETLPGPGPRWLEYVDRRLDALLNRPEISDDPEDYPKPPVESIKRARSIAWNYFGSETPTPNVVPSTEGGVDFVWYKGDWHLEIRVDMGGVSIWAHNLLTGELWQGALEEKSEDLRKLLVELAGVS